MLDDLRRVQRKLSKNKLFRILKRYESEKQIEKLSDGRSTLISVLNYEQYQNIGTENETEMRNKWETSGKPVGTKELNKRKKIKKRNKEDPSLDPEGSAPVQEEENPSMMTDEEWEALGDSV
jgi:hypothetical protein